MAKKSRELTSSSFYRWDPVALPRFAWRETHARGTFSLLASCIIHTVIFIVLATWYIAIREEEKVFVLQAAIAGQDEVSLEFSELPSIEPPASELPQTVSSPSPVPELELDVDAELARTQQSINATLTSALAATERSVGSMGGLGEGGVGAKAGDALSKLGANFFGSYAQGERFVFVLDSSKSMAGDRWVYACQELMDSVSSLESHQKFFVICFDDKTTCMFNVPGTRTRYYENDQATVSRLNRWLLTRKLGPGTFPANALMMALKMQPDAIFLLSDGEIRDNSVWQLRTANGFSSEYRQIPIHTVHLMSLEGRATLQLIATENGGTFTPVQGGGEF